MNGMLRPALPGDLDALYQLEHVCFDTECFNRRQLAHLLKGANAVTLVATTAQDELLGYGMLLFRRNSQRARLYSFGVRPSARGGGIGRRLLTALEAEAYRRGSALLALEVRVDNRVALGFYRRADFKLVCWLDDYYSDGCAAWQMEKRLALA